MVIYLSAVIVAGGQKASQGGSGAGDRSVRTLEDRQHRADSR